MAAPTLVTAERVADRAGATHRRLWRVAGWLAIAHVVLVFAGAAAGTSPQLGDPASAARDALVTSSLPGGLAGGYVSYLGVLALLVLGPLVARLLRSDEDDELTGWMSSCVAGSALVAVATSIATGFAAGAAALYDGHHGVDVATVVTVNDIRTFGFILTSGVIGVFLIAIGIAGRRTATITRPLTTTALVLGVASVGLVPGARIGLTAITTMAWYLWLVAFGISAVRRGGRT